MTGRILWVDDEIDLLKPHCIFLEKRGYEVNTTSNGTDAIDLCRDEDYDLILLDENMPGLSGLETLAAIKAFRPSVPIVMVTKNEAEDLMEQAIGQQIADYLIKPVLPTQVLLTLKKNIHQRAIVQEVTEKDYRQEFANLSIMTDEAHTETEWRELYKRLTNWELRLATTPESAMADMLRQQKEDANIAFSKFVRKNYEQWLTLPNDDVGKSRPMLSHDLMRCCVFPRLSAGRRVFLLVLDNFRYDQWRIIAEDLVEDFDIDEDLYYSILPTATQYARNAIFAGLLPSQIKKLYPDLWVDEDEDEGKNLNEEALIKKQMERFRRKEAVAYFKLNDSAAADKLLSNHQILSQAQLNVLVINFIDILSHARTESRMVRELASNEAAYRAVTQSWFRHTAIRELFRSLAAMDCDIIITTDHGSIRVSQPTKVVGDKNVNTNLRYKLGKNLKYNAKEVLEARNPEAFQLPSPNLSTAYIFATGNRFFAYPNNYNYYVQYYRDTFQHGGISMEEMIIPVIALRPKKR